MEVQKMDDQSHIAGSEGLSERRRLISTIRICVELN